MSALDSLIIATLFYEPSTRTRLSFETAIMRLGGKNISTENAKGNNCSVTDTSSNSSKKGFDFEIYSNVGYIGKSITSAMSAFVSAPPRGIPRL